MEFEITAEELDEGCLIIDIRDNAAFKYGHIEGAVNIPEKELSAGRNLPCDKKLVICSKGGIASRDIVRGLREKGAEAYNLSGGYVGWLRGEMRSRDVRETTERAEKSIRKKFHKDIFSKFAKAVNEYQLISPNDKIAVCISGGKDSMLMAKLFQEIQRHRKFFFETVFLVMDPGYTPENLNIIEENARALSIPITVFKSEIFNSVYHVEKNPCYLCARMRRGYLYSRAKELGCNKIALGHHFDDVIETILMGMLYGGQVQTMMPKLRSTNFPGMELIRPLYLIREADIKHWRDYNKLHFLQCACRFTEASSDCNPEENASKRLEVKNLIARLKETNPQVEKNIFRSVENVNLHTVIAYKDDSGVHNFLDRYGSAVTDDSEEN